jgi:hypothetical protein
VIIRTIFKFNNGGNITNICSSPSSAPIAGYVLIQNEKEEQFKTGEGKGNRHF